jgi:hypothetical protein
MSRKLKWAHALIEVPHKDSGIFTRACHLPHVWVKINRCHFGLVTFERLGQLWIPAFLASHNFHFKLIQILKLSQLRYGLNYIAREFPRLPFIALI